MNTQSFSEIPQPLVCVLNYLQSHGYEAPYHEVTASLPDDMDFTDYNPFSKYKEDYIHDLFAHATKIALHHAPSDSEGQQAIHDRLFEVLMRRFDVLSTYRPLLCKIYERNLSQLDPFTCVARVFACEQQVISAVGGNASDHLPLNEVVFLWFYTPVFITWLKESSPESEKIMAKLDKAISQYQEFSHN